MKRTLVTFYELNIEEKNQILNDKNGIFSNYNIDDGECNYFIAPDGTVWSCECDYNDYMSKLLTLNNDEFEILDGVLLKYKGDPQVEEIVIPSGVRVIGDTVFCQFRVEMKSVILPEGLEEIGWMAFACCSKLTFINIPKSLKKIGKAAFYDCSALKELEIPDGIIYLGNYAFKNCKSLTKINIPKQLRWIGEYDALSLGKLSGSHTAPDSNDGHGIFMFEGCCKLKNINMPFLVRQLNLLKFQKV